MLESRQGRTRSLRGGDAVVERKRERTTDSSIDRSRTKAVGKKGRADR